MPRNSRAQVEAEAADLLPADGSWMPYDDYVAALNGAGLYNAVQMLRGMKHRGLIDMRLRRVDGANLHEVQKVVNNG